ncbi:MAG: 2-oxoisovalerate dehydrogenase [Chloroflexi bacterium]|nr:2-oxoisovalerate dehydrogenase [Chloroflexota bacterium]
MDELIFLVEDAPEGGYTARALGAAIFTEADTLSDLQEQIRDAVRVHYDEAERPKMVRMHFVREEVIAV